MKLSLPHRARKRVLTRDPLQTVQALNMAWSLDFMRDTLYDGRPFRTLGVMMKAAGRGCAPNVAAPSPTEVSTFRLSS